MRATTNKVLIPTHEKIAVNTEELASLLSCGLDSAYEIGSNAGAKICYGRRVLWSTEKVKEYVKKVATY